MSTPRLYFARMLTPPGGVVRRTVVATDRRLSALHRFALAQA